jgi:hypothetical protein
LNKFVIETNKYSKEKNEINQPQRNNNVIANDTRYNAELRRQNYGNISVKYFFENTQFIKIIINNQLNFQRE